MLNTEMRNEKTTHIDTMSTMEMLTVINEENKNSITAVENALPEIALAVDAITESMQNGGRLFYIGAGTSGRIGVMDAAECPPTFGVEKNLVIGIMAGGENCMVKAQENVEDDALAGEHDFMKYSPTSLDVLVGISAAGSAKYVISALEKAKEIGCTAIALTSNKNSPIDLLADISIYTNTGAEVITGSTRMKAGTSQKLVLNMLSTCAMIKTGKVYENLMINLKPTNEKLKNRMIGIASEITGYDWVTSEKYLCDHNWSLKKVLEDFNS